MADMRFKHSDIMLREVIFSIILSILSILVNSRIAAAWS
jgi:hypothetical protein